ncbi:ROK family protein [Pengzhenrongella sp.]|uniref:ROK family protein n=1 Tax=Pengzhenrongella sp. TaxID=2888820 RepID=UPI002F92ACBB
MIEGNASPMTTSDGEGSRMHDGFRSVLESLTARDPKKADQGVSEHVLGTVLEELAIAAPIGCLRSELRERMALSDGPKYSVGTLSKALTVLEQHGLISSGPSYAGPKGGRRPERYRLGSDQWAMLGIHVTLKGDRPRTLTCTLRDLTGLPIDSLSRGLTGGGSNWSDAAKEIAACAVELIRTWRDHASRDARKAGSDARPVRNILGIGIEVPGHVHNGEVVHVARPNFESENAPLAAEIRDRLRETLREDNIGADLTVVLDNDVNMIALRETYRPNARSRPRDGVVVAVFDDGVGAGLLANGRIYRGHGGAAGEPGHNPVFVEEGVPRLVSPPMPPLNYDDSSPPAIMTAPDDTYLTFTYPCSCKRKNHLDCYATPSRLTGELNRPLGDFSTLALSPAYDAQGDVTAAGTAFWKGGAALGHGVVSLIHAMNPGWLLLLLPPALAEVKLQEGELGDGTAAGLYRQAIETVVKEHAFSTSDADARNGGRWLDVKALSDDLKVGAEKAARNAAIRVLDEFIAHALQRDRCRVNPLAAVQPALHRSVDHRLLDKQRRIILTKQVEEIVRYYDPEGLIGAGAPDDEYSVEESELVQQISRAEATPDTVRALWLHSFGTGSNLLKNSVRLNSLASELIAVQTQGLWAG